MAVSMDTSPVRSFLSFSDNCISSSLSNIGISMGKKDDEVSVAVGALKHMEIVI